jgi:hypothetical protein
MFLHSLAFLAAGLLGGLLFVQVRPAVTQAGDDNRGPAADASHPEVFALLFVGRRPPQLLEEAGRPADPEEVKNEMRSQLALLRTRLVLTRALHSTAVARLPLVKKQKDPVAWLEKHVRAEFLNRSQVLCVSVPVGTPQEQATLTNAVVSAYLTEVGDKDRQQRRARFDALQKLHEKHDERMAQKRRKLREMADALAPWLKEEFALKELHALETELIQVRSQLRRAQVEMAVLKEKAGKAPVTEARIEGEVQKDLKLADLLQMAKTLERRLTQIRENLARPEEFPEYRRLLTLLKERQQDIAARRKAVRPEAEARAREQPPAGKRAALEQLEQKTAVLKRLEEVLRVQVDRHMHQLDKQAKGGVDLQWLRDEIAELEEMVRTIAEQRRRLEVELEAPRRIQLLQEATAPK